MRCVLVAVLIAAGCVDQGPGPKPKVAPGFVAKHLLASEPADLQRFDVNLGGKVVYLGNKLDRTAVAPGQVVTITHYWKVLAPIGANWRPFGLVRGPAGSADFMNLDPTEMLVAHPPARWAAGQIIEDVQPITMRPDWRSPTATVLVGLIEVGKHGTLDRMAATGPRTQDRAIVAATLQIDLARAPPPPGTIHIPRSNGTITIDGVGNDPGWSNAVVSPELVTAEGSPDPIGKASAKLTWDDQALYLLVNVSDTDIVSPYKQQDEPLWKADCIEIFIDADGNRRGYVELQVNPHNTTFDSWFSGGRGPAGDEAWDSEMRTAVQLRGSAEPGTSDTGWDVEIAIPWATVKGKDDQMPIRTPPQLGDRWRLNVVRVDKRSGNDTVSATSWNRISYRDFHALERMLVAVFADPTGMTTPSPAGDGSGMAPAGTAPPATGSAGSAAPNQGSATAPPVGAGSGSATAPTRSGSAATAPRGSAATLLLQGTATLDTSGTAARNPDAPLQPSTGSGSASITAPRASAAGSAAPRAGSAAGSDGSAARP